MPTLLDHDPYYRAPSDEELLLLGDLEYRGPIYEVNRPLIGVTGEKGHGKDTVCKRLATFGIERHAWADKLKNVARDLWGLSHDQVHGTIAQKETADERWGLTPRHFLQVLGTEVARKGHPETWIRFLLQALANRRSNPYQIEGSVERVAFEPFGFAVSDVRFPNEADAIRKHGGIVLRVVRDFRTGQFEHHASEIGVRAIRADYVIVNDSDLDALDVVVDEFMRVARGWWPARERLAETSKRLTETLEQDYLWYLPDLTDPASKAVPLATVKKVNGRRCLTWVDGEPHKSALSPISRSYMQSLPEAIAKFDDDEYFNAFNSPHTNVFFGDSF